MRSSVAFALALFAVVLALTLHGTAPEPVPVLQDESAALDDIAIADATPPRSIEALRARIAEVLARERVPGVAIALVDRQGVIWSGGVGVRDLGDRVPVDGDTVFRVASITKGIVGLGVMRLAEQGRIDLDRPLSEVAPEVVIDNRWHDVAPVTVAHALEHTAGFDDMRFNETFTENDAMSVGEALAINPGSRVVRWRPGSRMAYSNVGFSVAGRAIEAATGEPFDAWLRREVLLPLGMRDADFQRTPALASRLATGYRGPDRPARFVPIAHRPAGALLASANDLAQLVHFWLRRGDGFAPIVSPAGLARIERSGTLAYPSTDLVYGLGNYGDVAHPVRSRGHDGGLPGFSSCMRYFPELGVGYVVLLNATHSGRAMGTIRRHVFSYLAAGRVLPPLPPIPDGPPVVIEADAYAFANPRHELFGFIDRVLQAWTLEAAPGRGRLASFAGSTIDVVPTADGGFRRPHESGTSIRPARDVDGQPILVAGGAYAEGTSSWLVWLRRWALIAAAVLLQLAPLFALGVLAAAALRRRAVPALGLVVWPGIAGLAFVLVPVLLQHASASEGLGTMHAWTLAICGTTMLFALASGAGLVAALRWSMRGDRPGLRMRLLPSLAATAAFGMTLWAGAHGLIGLRTWAW